MTLFTIVLYIIVNDTEGGMKEMGTGCRCWRETMASCHGDAQRGEELIVFVGVISSRRTVYTV